MSSYAIFIRSYRKDLPWLTYCLRSIQKYATGFSEVIVAVPESDKPLLDHLTAETVIGVHDNSERGYLQQQNDKLHADEHTQADYILHIDSDTVFDQPVHPDNFIEKGRPRWVMAPWEDGSDSKKAWFHVVSKALQDAPAMDFMRCPTVMLPRFAYAGLRDFIQKMHGLSVEQYIMNQSGHEFSEYSVMGAWLWKYHREAMSWHDAQANPIKGLARQKWSHGGLTPEIREELEEITK